MSEQGQDIRLERVARLRIDRREGLQSGRSTAENLEPMLGDL